MTSYEILLEKIRQVRHRWRSQVMIRGIAISLAAIIALLVLGIWGADLFDFKPAAVWSIRFLTGAIAIFAVWRFLYLPLRVRVRDVTVAQYIEEKYPHLEDRLVTAIEYGDRETPDAGMIDLLIKDALKNTSRIDLSVFLNRKRLAAFGILGIGTLGILMSLFLWGPTVFRYGFSNLYAPWTEASLGSARSIQVVPGNIEIIKGSDQLIDAQLIGFDSPDVFLYRQLEESDSWDRTPMEVGAGGGTFRYLLVDIQNSHQYYVSSEGVRSPVYSLNVAEQAHVDSIDLTYNFPAYTGMSPQFVDNEGDISALKGTRMDLDIHLNIPVRSARLLFEDRTTLDLEADEDKDFTGSFVLEHPGSYTVEVTESRGGRHTASTEYAIEVIEDEAPKVTITRPMRDVRATNVEEVFAEIKAEDDIGMGRVDLRYSVNGSEEKAIRLYRGDPPESSVTATYTFFLEEFGLHPGDLVSYYAKGWDSNNTTGPTSSSSDIYFIQIRPFQLDYRQSQEQSMPSGSGQQGEGGEGQEALSRQQKDIISATFNLIRDKERMDEKEYEDALKSLALIQNRLQDQAQGLADRMERRNAGDAGIDFQKLEEYLNNAIDEMGKAAADLGAQKPSDALPQEQKSLQQLMRAESLFREIQVSFSTQQPSSSGSGSQANAEDLADLFELELNKLKNQYETLQSEERQEQDQRVDEALSRLKELAERQQQLNESNRLRAQRQMGTPPSSSSSGSQSQEQILEQAEQLRRQLQKLSRERSSPQINEASNRLQRAIDEMKQALEDSQNRTDAETEARQERALQQLNDAIRDLARNQESGLKEGLEQAVDASENLVQQQEKIQEELDRLADQMPPPETLDESIERSEGLVSRKELLAEQLDGLENQIRNLSRQARKTEKSTSDRLADAADTIQDRRLSDRIEEGNLLIQNGFYESQQRREEYIRDGLEEVQRQLEVAQNSVGESEEGRMQEASDRARQLAEGLESMQRRMQAMQSEQQNRPDSQQQGQQQNRSNSQQQAQQQPGQNPPQERSGQQGQQQPGQNRQQERPGQQAGNNRGDRSEQAGNLQDPRTGSPTPNMNVPEFSENALGPPAGIERYGDRQRQWNSELEQRLDDAVDLRNLMNRNSTQMRNLEEVIDTLMQSLAYPDYADREQLELLKAAAERMREVEFDLARDLERLRQVEEYFLSGDNEAPENYRKLVEEYYKSIAESD